MLVLFELLTMSEAVPEAATVITGPPVLAQDEMDQLGPIIDRATGWLIGILAGIATLFLTIGGVRYVLAGGDPQQVEGAKRSLRNALIGYAFAALAPIILAIARMILGV